jgi:hypothetical protein
MIAQSPSLSIVSAQKGEDKQYGSLPVTPSERILAALTDKERKPFLDMLTRVARNGKVHPD